MFETLLVANRGEIACRIMRTARRLGIRTVAVYSDADAAAQHVRRADAAVRIGPARASESYLNVEAVLAAARAAGADAVHPGYGFLSENVEFATRCRDEGIIFVGPTPEAGEDAAPDRSAPSGDAAEALARRWAAEGLWGRDLRARLEAAGIGRDAAYALAVRHGRSPGRGR